MDFNPIRKMVNRRRKETLPRVPFNPPSGTKEPPCGGSKAGKTGPACRLKDIRSARSA
jgi:hypothetical protein